MNQRELNDYLRGLVEQLVGEGYKATNIGKLLFGLAAFSQVQKFIKSLDSTDINDHTNFGIAPLTKIGKLLDYDLHLVFISEKDKDLHRSIVQKNVDFFEELKVAIRDYLNQQSESKKSGLDSKKAEQDIDDILKMLSEDTDATKLE
jgi:hypothetical protein